jgi:hypothetical protein
MTMPFLKYFFAGVIIPFAIILGMAIYIQPLVGDLTRLGNVSERSWGWNQALPVVSIDQSATDSDFDVLVIGDSFSEKDIWQSVMRDITGLKFKTFRWEDFSSPACLEAGIRHLKRQFPKIRYVVIETVERSAVTRFTALNGKIDDCPVTITSSIYTKASNTLAIRNKSLDSIPDALYTIKAFLSEPKKYHQTTVSGYGYISPLKRTDLFSNQKSDALLYFAGDLEKLDWTEAQIKASLNNLEQLSQIHSQQGLKIIFAIVPDKSTAYSEYLVQSPSQGKSIDIWQKLNATSLNVINLKTAFSETILKTQDFYLPDDTHLSTVGYQSLASEISKSLK